MILESLPRCRQIAADRKRHDDVEAAERFKRHSTLQLGSEGLSTERLVAHDDDPPPDPASSLHHRSEPPWFESFQCQFVAA